MSAGEREALDALDRLTQAATEGYVQHTEEGAKAAREKILAALLRAREGDGVAGEDARSAYMNARTCICGRDASEHVILNHVSRAYTCAGFDPDWEGIRRTLERAQAPQPAPEAGEVEKLAHSWEQHAVMLYANGRPEQAGAYETCAHEVRTLAAPPVTTEVDDG